MKLRFSTIALALLAQTALLSAPPALAQNAEAQADSAAAQKEPSRVHQALAWSQDRLAQLDANITALEKDASRLRGEARTKADADVKWLNAGTNDIMRGSESYKSTSFAYGAGIIINPLENLTVNVGYEGTTADLDDNYSINGFNIGVGYRF